jgi:hypothetical protein
VREDRKIRETEIWECGICWFVAIDSRHLLSLLLLLFIERALGGDGAAAAHRV